MEADAPGPPARALAWAGAVTTTALVMAEQHAELPAAVVAFAAAAWVVTRGREQPGGPRG